MQDLGIVLKKKSYKEKDEIVTLLTKSHGKVIFMSYGSRDPRSKKAGALQLTNTVEFLARPAKDLLPTLSQVRLITSRGFDLAKDLDAFYRAMELLKICDFLLKEKMTGPYFEMLEKALEHLDFPSVELVFEIRLLQESGFLPRKKIPVSDPQALKAFRNLAQIQ